MRWLLYLRLFYLTAATLLPFFSIVVILGHRRQRDFERIFFFLCLALVCFFGSSLLAILVLLIPDRRSPRYEQRETAVPAEELEPGRLAL